MTVEQVIASIQLGESLLAAAISEIAQSKAVWSASDMATVVANLTASEGRLAAAKAQADEDAA